MSVYSITIVHRASLDGAKEAPAPAPPATPGAPVVTGTFDRNVFRDQIRQSIRQAEAGLRDVANYESQVRAAEQRVQAAERQVQTARTADQRGGAAQELAAAQAELKALQGVRVFREHTIQPPFAPRDLIPSQAVDIAFGFFVMMAVIIIGWPLARAIGRRLERRADAPASADPAIAGQLHRIEQAVEAMAIEIERISESQRFMAKLQNGVAAERSALGTGAERR